MTKYKPGDIVIINSKLTQEEKNSLGWYSDMDQFTGQLVTITNIIPSKDIATFYIKEDYNNYRWNTKWIIPMSLKELNKSCQESN